MEKINNKRGSITIEAVIIVPLIMIIVMLFTIIMIISYEKSIAVILTHRNAMGYELEDYSGLNEINIKKNNNEYYFEKNYIINLEEKNISYYYLKNKVDVKTVQNIIEFIIYLVDEYEERLINYD